MALFAHVQEELRGLRRGSKQSSSGSLLDQAAPIKLTSDPRDYVIFTSIGERTNDYLSVRLSVHMHGYTQVYIYM